MEKRTTLFDNGLIWFGAGVSLAEIITGTYFASLGFSKAITVILLGHILGCTLLFLAGVIGGKRRVSAMESTKLAFGKLGGLFFAAMNVLQLAGWTAIMIYDGALAAGGIFNGGQWLWCLVIGALIVLWICVCITSLKRINIVAMAGLFLLTVVLCVIVFGGGAPASFGADDGSMSFGAALELAVAMPLSWLPLISDYTRQAEHPVKASAVSAGVYGAVSCWMYIIGLGAALFTAESDIAAIFLSAGLGVAGLLVVVLSTVTTTFLDAYSAGISAESILPNISGKYIALVVAALGTVAACLFAMDDITDFLYLIGSVFAPMIAIQITYQLILNKDCRSSWNLPNCIIWVLGFALYRAMMLVDIPVGYTLPTMLVTGLLCFIVHKLLKK